MKPKVFTVVTYFLPGYKGGGPMKSVRGLIDGLKFAFDFYVLTKDRDLGDKIPYKDILVDKWSFVDGMHRFYASPSAFNAVGIFKTMRNLEYDILYLNSFFSFLGSICPLCIHKYVLKRKQKIVLLPRGELHSGALQLKSVKKRLYIGLSNFIGLYNNVLFQATSTEEAKCIEEYIKARGMRIQIAPNVVLSDTKSVVTHGESQNEFLKVVFLSRISRKKNLLFLLKILQKFRDALILEIYGPIEDADYWELCLEEINVLPSNIRVNYMGHIPPENVSSAFGKNDLFVFPTAGENFGHVILESLSSGTCVLTSKDVPWPKSESGVIQFCDLSNESIWLESLEKWCNYDSKKKVELRNDAKKYASDYISSSNSIRLNKEILDSCLIRQMT